MSLHQEIVGNFFCLKQGHRVFAFDDPRNAQRAVEDGLEYDVALIDREFGQCNGDDLINYLRSENPYAKIVCTSAYNDKPRKANMLLLKPFSIDGVIKNELKPFLTY